MVHQRSSTNNAIEIQTAYMIVADGFEVVGDMTSRGVHVETAPKCRDMFVSFQLRKRVRSVVSPR